RRHNPAILAATSERGFVDHMLAGQPEPPMYFARMKRLNRDGAPVLGTLPRPRHLAPEEFAALDTARTVIVDTRPWRAFKSGHPRGALFAPLDGSFHAAAGSYIEDDAPIVLVIEPARIEEAVRELVRIGLDRVEGFIDPGQLESCVALGMEM